MPAGMGATVGGLPVPLPPALSAVLRAGHLRRTSAPEDWFVTPSVGYTGWGRRGMQGECLGSAAASLCT